MNFKKNLVKISMLSVILVLFGALFCYSKAINLPAPAKEFYISDFANVLSDETKSYILNQSNALNEKTSAQIVVATVDSLEGTSIEEYAVALFRNWGIGSKEKNNGLLILLAPNERQIRAEVGYGLEGKINDSKAGRFIKEYAVPHLKNNDWDNGIHDLYSVILSEVYSEYNMELPSEVQEVSKNIKGYDHDTLDDMVTIFISIAVIITSVIISFLVRRRRRRGYGYNNDDFHGGFGGFGGGYFGGGSSGGGFGGFSGGGGSSGGGGASSSF